MQFLFRINVIAMYLITLIEMLISNYVVLVLSSKDSLFSEIIALFGLFQFSNSVWILQQAFQTNIN
jgi:hypothetical protein